MVLGGHPTKSHKVLDLRGRGLVGGGCPRDMREIVSSEVGLVNGRLPEAAEATPSVQSRPPQCPPPRGATNILHAQLPLHRKGEEPGGDPQGKK